MTYMVLCNSVEMRVQEPIHT